MRIRVSTRAGFFGTACVLFALHPPRAAADRSRSPDSCLAPPSLKPVNAPPLTAPN